MHTTVAECLICTHSTEEVWDLPKLPLTGIYVGDEMDVWGDTTPDYFHDQALLHCKSCGHGQLKNQVDAEFLYHETYSHRTSESTISTRGNQFFFQFIVEELQSRPVTQALEIGCNDLFLLESLGSIARFRAGIDPIWPREVSTLGNGIRLSGDFAESVDYSGLVDEPIDLVVTAHTFEHIMNPRLALDQIAPYLSKKCSFFIEVPSAERMTDQARLDQVFSQHVQYYSVSSLIELMRPYGFSLRSLKYNFSYWGGTQLLHFSNEGCFKEVSHSTDIDYRQAIQSFESGMNTTRHQLTSATSPLYAFGAAQMLPILSYHIGEPFELVTSILDDNPSRQGKRFPYCLTPIVSPSQVINIQDATILITALDSARILMGSAFQLGFRSILLPIGAL